MSVIFIVCSKRNTNVAFQAIITKLFIGGFTYLVLRALTSKVAGVRYAGYSCSLILPCKNSVTRKKRD